MWMLLAGKFHSPISRYSDKECGQHLSCLATFQLSRNRGILAIWKRQILLLVFFWLNSRYSYINRHWTHLYTAKSWKSKQKEKKEKANIHIYLRHSPRIRYLNKEKSLAWTQKFQFYFYPSGLACILLKTTTSSKERHKEAQSWTLGFNTRWHSAINLYKNGWMIIDPKMERGKEKKKTQN